jgi:hypothetical protein
VGKRKGELTQPPIRCAWCRVSKKKRASLTRAPDSLRQGTACGETFASHRRAEHSTAMLCRAVVLRQAPNLR